MFVNTHNNRGFTLIELSIVLLIISLITGGIIAGRSLVQSAKLTDLADTVNKYQTATRAFELQYHALPGDIANATEYWPGQTYSGNDNGNITETSQGGANAADGGSADVTENRTYFEQLALAGLVEGSYDSTTSGKSFALFPEKAYFIPIYSSREQLFGCFGVCSFSESNYLRLANIGTTGPLTPVAFLSPPDAKTLDMKIDDGRPGTGAVTVINFTDCTNVANYSSMGSAKYKLEHQTPKCGMVFEIN